MIDQLSGILRGVSSRVFGVIRFQRRHRGGPADKNTNHRYGPRAGGRAAAAAEAAATQQRSDCTDDDAGRGGKARRPASRVILLPHSAHHRICCCRRLHRRCRCCCCCTASPSSTLTSTSVVANQLDGRRELRPWYISRAAQPESVQSRHPSTASSARGNGRRRCPAATRPPTIVRKRLAAPAACTRETPFWSRRPLNLSANYRANYVTENDAELRFSALRFARFIVRHFRVLISIYCRRSSFLCSDSCEILRWKPSEMAISLNHASQSNSINFTCVFNAPAVGLPLEFCNVDGA